MTALTPDGIALDAESSLAEGMAAVSSPLLPCRLATVSQPHRLRPSTNATDQRGPGEQTRVVPFTGVQEYWQYDPTQDYVKPALQGLELIAGEYQRLPGRELAEGTPALASEVLGLELRLSERRLRFHDRRPDRTC